jgi:hypothetical protein
MSATPYGLFYLSALLCSEYKNRTSEIGSFFERVSAPSVSDSHEMKSSKSLNHITSLILIEAFIISCLGGFAVCYFIFTPD